MTAAHRLRILEVAALPFPSRQGTQVMLHYLCEGLARRGHEVHLLAYSHGAFDVDRSYEIRRVPDRPRLRSLRSGPSWRRAVLDLRLAIAIRAAAREISADVVHLHNVEAGAAGLIVPPRMSAPAVYHAHNVMAEELPTYFAKPLRAPARAFGAWLDAELPRRAARTLAVSASTRDALVRLGADPHRIATVEPGLDLTDLAAGERPAADRVGRVDPAGPRLCHIGNLDSYQGIDLLLDAAADMRARGSDPTVVLITESEPGPAIEAAKLRGVRVRVERHGPVDRAIAAARSCDVAVIARTVRGGFPIKLALLMAAGVPVAAAPAAVAGLGVDAIVRVASDSSGAALADAIETALADPRLRRRATLGKRLARARWSPEAAAERLEGELLSVVRPAVTRTA